MLVSSTIWVLLLAIMPILFYSYLIYFYVPKNYISIQRARRYLVAGLLSPSIISLFYFIFPEWGDPQSTSLLPALIIFAVVQIGLLEESAKYLTFWWVSKERPSEKFDLPIATMFYCMMSAVGFAITENIHYLIRVHNELSSYGLVPHDQIQSILTKLTMTRSMVSVTAHMICGIILGYFLTKAHSQEYKFHYNPSCRTPEEEKKSQIRKWKYILIGLATAALYHGLFDLNLMLPDNIYNGLYMVVILVFGCITGQFIIKNLIRQSMLRKKNDTLNNTKQNENCE